jgi:hypothetical protein
VLGTSPTALASPLFELTGDPQSQGGLNPRTSGSGAATAYFNPALLPAATRGVSFGLLVVSQQIGVHLEPRASSLLCPEHACDVPIVNDSGPDSFRRADGSMLEMPGLPTQWLQQGRVARDGALTLAARPRQAAGTGQDTLGYASLGLVQTLAQGRIGLGLYTLLPLDDFMQARAFYPDEREQFFSNSLHAELYGDRLSAGSIAFGAGVQLSERLALGVSLTLAISSSARAPAYISNLSDLNTLLIDSNVGVSVSLAPHFGMALRATDRLRLSATLHSPQVVDIRTEVVYVVASGIEQRTEQNFTQSYMPWTGALGAELAFGEPGAAHWSAVVTALYALWSQYRDRHDERPAEGYAWGDVFSGSAGLRYTSSTLKGFLDGSYQPSPVPAQTGRTNYVDNARAAVAFGGSFGFTLWGLPAECGLSAQLHRLFPRAVHKVPALAPGLVVDEVPDDSVGGTPRGPIAAAVGLQTNNPGFPGFRSDGFILAAGAHFKLTL